LMQRLEKSVMQEAGASVGYLLPIPSGGDDSNVSKLKSDLGALEGKIAVIETTRSGWQEGNPNYSRDYELVRFGPQIPETSARMFTIAQEVILAACGYPVQLSQSADGTAQREAWRRYLHGTVAPLGRLVEESARLIGLDIALSFEALFASDIMGRARAFGSLVQGGMDITQAAAISGILSTDTENQT